MAKEPMIPEAWARWIADEVYRWPYEREISDVDWEQLKHEAAEACAPKKPLPPIETVSRSEIRRMIKKNRAKSKSPHDLAASFADTLEYMLRMSDKPKRKPRRKK